ncbi:MAG TPA: hypothetical protein VFY16_12555, partial [Gemmatimonadaceae bacterium]|nr:hypothetical protein [Gemmatimonadaceae bacterium]
PAIGIIGSLRRRWRALREAGIGWGDVLRGRVPAHLGGRDPAVERARVLAESRATRVQAAWADPGVVARRVRRFRTWAFATALLPVAGLAGAFIEGEALFALAMVATAATGMVTAARGVRLRRLGLRMRDMLRSGWEQAVVAADPRPRSAVAAADAARLVPADVLAGPHGALVRRAAEHRAEVRDVVRRMGAGDRALIPDVQPTVDALVERVALLAQTLHRLDADIGPDLLPTIETRIRAAEAEAGATPDGARRLTLLQRQRATIEDLLRRRATLLGQLESASLVLQSIKLDLIKLRSAGMQAALEDVNHATQEARALSRDIGHVLDAAAEVKSL